MAKEIEIPEGYEASIDGNKVIFVPKESKDERIRKAIGLILIATEEDQDAFYRTHNLTRKKCTAWLEKQKEQKPTENPMDIHNRGYVKGVEDAYNNVNEAKVILKRLAKENPKPAEWKPEPESLEALMYAIEGKWEMIKPTSYLSRRLEDLYEGVVNTFNVDESLVAHENDFTSKPTEWSEDDEKMLRTIISDGVRGVGLDNSQVDWLKSLRPPAS